MIKRNIVVPAFTFFFLISLFDVVSAQSARGDLVEMSMEDLMNIQVYSASKKSERFFNTAAAISVITPDDIRRSGATNIPDLLRMVPGVNVQRVNSHSWDISARGFNGSIFSNKLLVLIDGRAVYTPLYGGVFWDVQDVVLEDIERIEVIRGPGGTLWGANAVNGVINVITKKAKDTQGGLVSVGGGTEERAFTTLRYGGKTKSQNDDGWFYRTYGKYTDRDEGYRASGTANDQWQMARTGFRAEKEKLTYQGDFYQGWLGQRVSENSYTPPYTSINDKSATVQGGNFVTKYEDENSLLQTYWDVTNRDLQTLVETRNTFDLQYTRHFLATEKQEITWGSGYRLNLEDFKDTDTVVMSSTTQTDQVFNLFVQDEIKMMDDRLKLIVGSKLEHNIYTHFEVEPNVRISYSLDDNNFIWAAASRSVRTPSRLETDGEVTSQTTATPEFVRIIGSHDLSSEKMRSFELGYRNQFRPNILFDASIYADHYDDLVTFIPGDTITDHGFSVTEYPFVNGLAGDIDGIELSSDIKVMEWWKLKTYYTFTKSSLNTHSDITNIGLESSLEKSFPRHTAYLRSSFDLPHAFELDLTLRYRDSFLNGTVPSDTGVDINLSKTINNWQLFLVGQNLLRSHHFESSGTGIGLTQVERSGYIKLTHKF